jgi:DeoR/GlpR family transcriptional regulator of sugar metabolism
VSAQGHTRRARAVVPEQRRALIAERLRSAGGVTVAALEDEFGISPMTARRDLQILEREGRAQRAHGGAVSPRLARDEDSFQSRLEQAGPAKRRLAAAACALVGEGESVFVDSSTSAYFVVRQLLSVRRRVTVLTNSLAVMDLVARSDAARVGLIGLSGSLRKPTRSFVGPQTVRAVQAHFADKLMFSVKGLGPENVLTDADPLEAEVKRAMIERAAESVLLVDASKFERTGLSQLGPISAVATVLVAREAREPIGSLAEAGVRVREV